MPGDPRAWFDATAERMLSRRESASDLEVVGDLDVFQRDKRRRVLEWLASRQLAGRSVLEVGCGAAGNLRFLQQYGARVEGADVSPKMLEVSRRLNAARGVEFPLHLVDGAHLPHATGVMDVVLTVTALQHNHDGPDLESMVREIARVLCPGGEAWIIEGVHRVRSVHRQSVHRQAEEYRAMFTAAGLVEHEYWALHQHYPQWMAGWQRVATAGRRALGWAGRRALSDEEHFQRRVGDGATLDSVASRGLFALSRVADAVHRAPDALGFYVFSKPS